MIKGSLDKPAYQLVGDTVPYLFHDARAYADIYYCPRSNKFLTVTLFKDKEQTHIKVYSLFSPPEPLDNPVINEAGINYILWIGGLFVAGLGVAAIVFVYRRKNKGKQAPPLVTQPVMEPPAYHTEQIEPPIEPDHDNRVNNNKNAIFLFGDLQLFTPDGHEITK